MASPSPRYFPPTWKATCLVAAAAMVALDGLLLAALALDAAARGQVFETACLGLLALLLLGVAAGTLSVIFYEPQPRHAPSPDLTLNPAAATLEPFDYGVFPSRFDPSYNPASSCFQDEYPAPGGLDQKTDGPAVKPGPSSGATSAAGLRIGRR